MLTFFAVSYLFATFQEWYFHKFMHANSGSSTIQKNHQRQHAQAHAHTQALTSLVTFSDDICFDIRNQSDFGQFILCFTGNSAVLAFLFYPNVSLIAIAITTSSLLTFNVLVWNTYHAYIHGSDAFTLCYLKGIPREYVPTVNWYSSWIIDNHKKHHLFPAGNFNIVFPGADYLFGTKIITIQ